MVLANFRVILNGQVLRSWKNIAYRRRPLSTQPGLKELVQFDKIQDDVAQEVLRNFRVIPDFITEDEEKDLLEELEPKLRRMRYQYDHWDDAIHGFRETEQMKWNAANSAVFNRIKSEAFPGEAALLPHVHVLDLADNGWIKPHIDSVKFCGHTIAGVSLLSDSVMKLERETDGSAFVALLKRRSLYVMTGCVRYEFKHSILRNEDSYFGDLKVDKIRRISVICRNEPEEENL
uniref:Putative alpha-ketoglutarate-dependent dioxygenase ABH7 n=1 Tax=Lygus hesperus TaxID=30085 RepID=A0A0A9ZCK6_LYGHE